MHNMHSLCCSVQMWRQGLPLKCTNSRTGESLLAGPWQEAESALVRRAVLRRAVAHRSVSLPLPQCLQPGGSARAELHQRALLRRGDCQRNHGWAAQQTVGWCACKRLQLAGLQPVTPEGPAYSGQRQRWDAPQPGRGRHSGQKLQFASCLHRCASGGTASCTAIGCCSLPRLLDGLLPANKRWCVRLPYLHSPTCMYRPAA